MQIHVALQSYEFFLIKTKKKKTKTKNKKKTTTMRTKTRMVKRQRRNYSAFNSTSADLSPSDSTLTWMEPGLEAPTIPRHRPE